MSTEATRRQAEQGSLDWMRRKRRRWRPLNRPCTDDYNVRRYSFHIYFAYCVALYTASGLLHLWDPEVVLRSYYSFGEPLNEGGRYFARQAGAFALVMALISLLAWQSKSGPVRDLVIKACTSARRHVVRSPAYGLQVHFAHHLGALVVDMISEHAGLVTKSWQQGMFSPHPFFTGLILFMWATDKRRDLRAEEREAKGQ